MLKLISGFSLLALLVLIYSCNTKPTKQDFIAKYQIDQIIPVDTTLKTLLKIKQTANWVISLEENDNFELTGTEKNVVGYWNVEKIKDKEYRLLLQGGGWTIYGGFDGTTMHFHYPYKMFDSLFLQVSFTKIKK